MSAGQEESMGLIVAGIDHSVEAQRALRFALAEARLRGARLRVVHALDPFSSYPSLAVAVGPARQAAGELLERVADEAEEDADDLVIERRVVDGSPGSVLVAESRGADLLVVGSRGHGGFVGLLLGSVSQQCAHHAECPVVIVRQPPARSE